TRTRKNGKDAVAFPAFQDQRAVVRFDPSRHYFIVPLQGALSFVRMLFPSPARSFHVREQEGHRSNRPSLHKMDYESPPRPSQSRIAIQLSAGRYRLSGSDLSHLNSHFSLSTIPLSVVCRPLGVRRLPRRRLRRRVVRSTFCLPMPRCPWATAEPNITYHDREWGIPV